MKRKRRHHPLCVGAIALAFVTCPVVAARAADKVDTTTTANRGENSEVKGYWITITETFFDWVKQEYLEVVAYYRAYRPGWLREMETGKFGLANSWNHSGAIKEEQVRTAVQSVGWNNLLDYTVKNIPYAWQNQGIILIDPATNTIIGHLSVANSYDAINKTLQMKAAETDANVVGRGEVTLKLLAASVWASPIILDLEGLGKPDLLAGPTWNLVPGRQVAMSALRPFDLDGKGLRSWEWIGPRSGLLAWDADGRGVIRSGEQLFGNFTWGQTWKDGYEALATLDNNRDGVLTPVEFTNLVVWVDANSNSVCDRGEVRSLTSLGIESLSVRPERDASGNASAPRGFVRSVGGKKKTLPTWDWISMGYAQASEGTYVWAGEEGDKRYGGYLRLFERAGEIRGYSVPTIDAPLAPGGLIVAYPIAGKRVGDAIEWSLPSPDGTVLSEVSWEPGGKHLYGRTSAETKTAGVEYLWQAELIAGEPIGVLPAPRSTKQ